MPLNDARLRTLGPKERAYKVADFDGLFVLVKPTGSRLWQMKYRFAGKEKVLSFGAYPAISLARARQPRDEARADLAAGQDPGELKKERKREERDGRGITFASQAKAFIDKARLEGKAQATMDKTERLLGMVLMM